MPLHLRSGFVKNPPVKKYRFARDIFAEERAKNYSKLTPSEAKEMIQKEWENLDESKKEGYYEAFDKYDLSYKEELLSYYGHSKNDIKKFRENEDIPERPRKPLQPPLVYQHEVYDKVKAENPEESHISLLKIISMMYEELPAKEKSTIEKDYEKSMEEWKDKSKKWEEKYGEKMEEHEKFVIEKFRKKQTNQDKFEYVEYVKPSRPPRKLKIQEEEETKPVPPPLKSKSPKPEEVAMGKNKKKGMK